MSIQETSWLRLAWRPRGQTFLPRKECQRSWKREFTKNKNKKTQQHLCHDFEIYMVDNDVRVVTWGCLWLRNRLTAFVDDAQAISQLSPLSIPGWCMCPFIYILVFKCVGPGAPLGQLSKSKSSSKELNHTNQIQKALSRESEKQLFQEEIVTVK